MANGRKFDEQLLGYYKFISISGLASSDGVQIFTEKSTNIVIYIKNFK